MSVSNKQKANAETFNSAFVSKTVQTTKGDLIGRSTTDPVRIPVGTDGQVLTADSTQTSGVKWADATGGGGSGVGGINYISNYDAEIDTTGWAVYADAAGSRPVDGTGGAANITWTRTTSTPLRGNGSFLLTKDAVNRQGQGASFAFTIADADKASMQQINFEYEVASGTYATGDLAVYIYDVTNAVVIQPSAFNIENVGIESKARLTFQTASNSTSYRLCFHVASVSALAYSLKFDSITLGPQVVPLGALVTDWVSYTPTVTAISGTVTNFTVQGLWRRKGDSADYKIRLVFIGSPGTWSNPLFSLPPGQVVDEAKIPGGSIANYLDENWGTALDNGTQSYKSAARPYTTTTLIMQQLFVSGSAVNLNSYSQTSPFTWASGDEMEFTVKNVPIVGWSSSTVVSSSADTRSVYVTANAPNAGSHSAETIIAFTETADSHGAFSSNTFTAPLPGLYQFDVGALTNSFASSATGAIQLGYKISGGSTVRFAWNTNNGQNTNFWVGGSGSVYLNAGQTLAFYSTSTSTITYAQGVMSIRLLQGPSQIAASEVIAVSVPNGAATGTVNGSFNNVTFSGTEVVDTHGAFDGTTFTAPAPGLYDVYSRIELTAVSTSVGASEYIAIYKNGSLFTADVLRRASTSFTAVTVSVKGLVPLNAGDAITIRSSSGSITPSLSNALVGSSLTIKRLGGVM